MILRACVLPFLFLAASAVSCTRIEGPGDAVTPEPPPDLTAGGTMNVVKASGQARYLIDPKSHTCFLFIDERVSAGPVDCHRLAEGLPAAAQFITWSPERQTSPGTSAATRPIGAAFERSTTEGIKRLDATHIEISRAAFDEIFKKSSKLMRGARILPARKDGKPNGFRLVGIRSGSIYKALGLRNGDTVHTIGGHGIATPDEALEAYTKLRHAKKVTLELTRKGKRSSIHYAVVD